MKSIFDRFAVLFTIPIVWLYAYLLTVGGAYRNAPPKTQFHCRTDRSGLIGGAPWYSYCSEDTSARSLPLALCCETCDLFWPLSQPKWQDKSTISLSMGCSNFWRWWSFCNDGCIICSSCGGLYYCLSSSLQYERLFNDLVVNLLDISCICSLLVLSLLFLGTPVQLLSHPLYWAVVLAGRFVSPFTLILCLLEHQCMASSLNSTHLEHCSCFRALVFS